MTTNTDASNTTTEVVDLYPGTGIMGRVVEIYTHDYLANTGLFV